jgi:hypothetical protein
MDMNQEVVMVIRPVEKRITLETPAFSVPSRIAGRV